MLTYLYKSASLCNCGKNIAKYITECQFFTFDQCFARVKEKLKKTHINRISPKCISNKSHVEHYSSKFLYDKDEENYYIIHLRNKVKDTLSKIRNIGYSLTLSDVLMRKYIKKLKGNCSTCTGRICA